MSEQQLFSAPLTSAAKEEIRRALVSDRLLVIPTDTVYGIGANPFSKAAVAALLATKGRGEQMPPPVVGPNPESLFDLASFDDEDGAAEAIARRLAEEFWPGALTLVVPARPGLGWDTAKVGQTVAVRVPNNQLALEVLQVTGPLALTSANPTGEPPARTAAQAVAYFGDAVSIYVDGKESALPVPSTIVDCTSGRPKVLRSGGLDPDTLANLLPFS